MLLSFFKKRSDDKKLTQHPLFQKIDFAMNFQIERINIANHAKRNMIHAFLKLYFSEFKKQINIFLNSNKDNEPLRFIELFTHTLEKIDDEALCIAIPEIFIKKYNLLQQSHVESIYASLENIANSQFYHDNTDKISAMFDVLICHFVFITLDSEKTLNELNGRMEAALKGSIYED